MHMPSKLNLKPIGALAQQPKKTRTINNLEQALEADHKILKRIQLIKAFIIT